MATISIATSTVHHTLPDKFWGFNFSIGYFAGDFSQSQYLSFMAEISPEVWRFHDFERSNGANYSGFNTAKTFLLNHYPDAAVILNPDSGPDALPSSTSACSTTNVAPNGSGRSPSDHAALLANWLDAGIDVQLYEFDNEPWGHCAGNGPWWYGTGGGANADGYKCETWVSVHQRNFYNALRPVITARGKSTEVGAHVISTCEGYGYAWTGNFINAEAIQGACSSPISGSGSNIPYFDTYVFHAYPANPDGTNQGRINSLLTSVASPPPSNGTSLYGKLNDTRNKLNAVGGTTKKITYDEAGLRDVTAISGLCDAIYAVMSSRYQAQYNIARYCLHSANTDVGTSGIYPLFTTNSSHTSFSRTTRSNQLRDISSPFIRIYKRICIPTITGSGTSPGAYSVQRIQASSGLNAAGDTLGVLIVNVDLTNSETVTINLDTTPGGSASVTYMLQSTGAVTMPTTTIAPSGSSFTRTIEPGAVYLFEIPLTTIPPPPPPPPGSTGGWFLSDAQLDQLTANYTVGDANVVSAFNHFKSVADGALTSSPQPVTGNPPSGQSWSYSKDGSANDSYTQVYTKAIADASKCVALAFCWAATRTTNAALSASYGARAKLYLQAWQTTFISNVDHNFGHNAVEGFTFPAMFVSYDIVQQLFNSTEQTNYKNWASGFIARGKTHSDSQVDGYFNGNYTANDVLYNGETRNWQAWGNNNCSYRILGGLAACVVGGSTATSYADWNWSHNTAGGHANGWAELIDGGMFLDGMPVEAYGRNDLGYGAFHAPALALFAHALKNSGDTHDTFGYVHANGKNIFKPWIKIGPYVRGALAWPSWETAHAADPESTKQTWRARAEIPTWYASGAALTELTAILNYGGSATRGANYDAHYLRYEGILADNGLTPVTPPPPPPPVPIYRLPTPRTISPGSRISGRTKIAGGGGI